MKIDAPMPHQLPQLRQLWQEAFGDGDAFLDAFFAAGFSEDRCRCVTVDSQTAGMLYWFDCKLDGHELAYLYAVATGKGFRGRGVCRALMADTHAHLQSLGYSGAILVPGEEDLFRMYGKLGYQVCGGVREISCDAGNEAVPTRAVTGTEYAALRRKLLPFGGVLQEGENLRFLETQAELFAGDGFLLAANTGETALRGLEFLGEPEKLPGILKTLGKKRGIFRGPGNERPFAMYHPLKDAPVPAYFGLAFD